MSAGQAPYILLHDGEVTLFRSPEDLARYVEAPDLGGARAFDSQGRVIQLSSPPIRKKFGFVNIPQVTATLTSDVQRDELREALRNFVVDRAGLAEEALQEASLPDLLNRAESFATYNP